MGVNVPSGYKQTKVGVIPEDWEVVRLRDVFQFKNGLNKGKEFFGHGTPIVNYVDVNKNDALKLEDIKGLVSVAPNELKNHHVQKGDVWFAYACEKEGIDKSVYFEIIEKYYPQGFLRPKNLNLEARKEAGFSCSELKHMAQKEVC